MFNIKKDYLILAFAAFFSPWGEGMQHILPRPTYFYIVAVFLLLLLHWNLFIKKKFGVYDVPQFYKFLLVFVFIHSLIYCLSNPEILTFGRVEKKTANSDFLIEQASTGESLIRYFTFALFSLLLSYLFRDKRCLLIFAFFYSIGFSCTILLGGFSAEYDGLTRLCGGMSDPNIMALDGTLALFLSLYSLRNTKNVFKICIFVFCIVVSIFAILLSFSRGAFLALFVCIIILLFYKVKFKKILFSLIIVFLAGIVIYKSIPSNMRTMIEMRFSIGDIVEDGGAGRGAIWLEYLKNWTSYVVTGTGIANSQSVLIDSHSSEYRVTHNQYLLYLVEFGLVGFYFYLVYFVSGLKLSFRSIGSRYQFLVMPFISMSIISFFLNIDDGRSFWIIIAIINTIWYLKKKELFISKMTFQMN